MKKPESTEGGTYNGKTVSACKKWCLKELIYSLHLFAFVFCFLFCFRVVFFGCVGLFRNSQGRRESMHGRDLACSSCDVLWAASSSVYFGFCEARGT